MQAIFFSHSLTSTAGDWPSSHSPPRRKFSPARTSDPDGPEHSCSPEGPSKSSLREPKPCTLRAANQLDFQKIFHLFEGLKTRIRFLKNKVPQKKKN